MQLRIEIFPSDLDAVADFYTRVLGFAIEQDRRDTDDPYVSFVCGDVRLGAAGRAPVPDRAARRPPTGIEVVLEVDDLDAAHERVRREGWPVLEELKAQPWGQSDFRVLDPEGHYVRVSGPPA